MEVWNMDFSVNKLSATWPQQEKQEVFENVVSGMGL